MTRPLIPGQQVIVNGQPHIAIAARGRAVDPAVRLVPAAEYERRLRTAIPSPRRADRQQSVGARPLTKE